MRQNSMELGQERLTVDNTAGGVSLASVPQGATFAMIRLKGTAGTGICWTADGKTAPTTSVGMENEVGETILFDARLSAFKAIRRDGTNVTLIVSYFQVS